MIIVYAPMQTMYEHTEVPLLRSKSCFMDRGTPSFWALLGASFSISSSSRICIICIWAASPEIREPVCFHQGICSNFQNGKTNKNRKEFSAIGQKIDGDRCRFIGYVISFWEFLSVLYFWEEVQELLTSSGSYEEIRKTCSWDWDCTVFTGGSNQHFPTDHGKTICIVVLEACCGELMFQDVSHGFSCFVLFLAIRRHIRRSFTMYNLDNKTETVSSYGSWQIEKDHIQLFWSTNIIKRHHSRKLLCLETTVTVFTQHSGEMHPTSKLQSGAILQSARRVACWIVSSSPIHIYIYIIHMPILILIRILPQPMSNTVAQPQLQLSLRES